MTSPESCVSQVKNALIWWISGIPGQETDCTYKQDFMAHGLQSDTFSCGIVSYNTIAHDLFGDELWTSSNSRRFRIEAFNGIVVHHNASVSMVLLVHKKGELIC